MKNQFEAIIFDFDYTLADSSHGVFDCIDTALTEMNLPAVSYEASCRTIGLSLTAGFIELTGNREAQKAARFRQLFIKRADEIMADKTVLFGSTKPTIERLRKSGIPLGIVSTKFRYRIEAILARENLLKSFEVVVGGEDVSNHKPDPESLFLASEKLAVNPAHTLYVGDSVVDAETAQRAGVPFVAVLSGVTDAERFKGYEPLKVIDNLTLLPAMIGRLPT
ncbi:MAG: HAD-IA family hydrolase [Planctomycetes bacterium]|nr:HAD-IA family hydrolase [Planctomycetota bacterium]